MKDMRSIGNKSIFWEYSMDENRVTAALLHIIRLCVIELVKDLKKQRYTTIDKLITAKYILIQKFLIR